jgi:endonuclease-8
MPEGHSIKFFADVHERAFAGKTVQALSPQKRFADEAQIIDGKTLERTSAHGKHLFFHFDDENIVHVHLGLYGWFKIFRGQPSEPKDTVRLRIINDEFTSDLTAPTKCELLDADGHARVLKKLGPDPIHEDADPMIALAKIQKSKKSIAELLMDQSVIAGIGNVYRAELLFIVNQNPFAAGKTIGDRTFFRMWYNAVSLLRDGAEDGMIRTVHPRFLTQDEIEASQKYASAQFSYVYKRQGKLCRVCKSLIKSREIGGRTLYWCPTCQM